LDDQTLTSEKRDPHIMAKNAVTGERMGKIKKAIEQTGGERVVLSVNTMMVLGPKKKKARSWFYCKVQKFYIHK